MGSWGTALSARDGGTGRSGLTANGIVIGEGFSSVNQLVLADGQFAYGRTGMDPVAGTLTSTMGISQNTSSGGFTLSTPGGGWGPNEVLVSNVSASRGMSYICNNGATPVVFALPSTASSVIGDSFRIIGFSAGGWTITQAAGQQLVSSAASSTVGVTGGAASTNRYNKVEIMYMAAGVFSITFEDGSVTLT